MYLDTGSVVDCCTRDGKLGKDIDNPRCVPIYIPEDDPIYVEAGIECIGFDRTGTTLDYDCTTDNEPAYPVSTRIFCSI